MKKFSKLNESLTKEILGWSPNDILNELEKIPNCKAEYQSTEFIFRSEGGHEICSLLEMERGFIKSFGSTFELDPETEYNFSYNFSLNFGSLFENGYYYFDNDKELGTPDTMPLSKLTKIFSDIESVIQTLRSDFFIHLLDDKKITLGDLILEVSFTCKDSTEKEYIIR